MRTTPAANNMEKLPKWAQVYIKELEQAVRIGESTIKEYTDTQTPSKFSSMDIVCMSENKIINRYIQADRVSCTNAGVTVTVSPREDEGVDVTFETDNSKSKAALLPKASNVIIIRKVTFE